MSHFVLADCNNFYASCERLFNPKLEGKPVVVLSNNDGCIIARSEEAKKLGIKMGEPYFMAKERCETGKIFVFSSNFPLYQDISDRVMMLLSHFAPEIEIYSIDEAFMRFPPTLSGEELFDRCVELKKIIKQSVGIPLSIGIGPTKTLAKAANYLAKKKEKEKGVFSLHSPLFREKILKEFPIEEVWGIGWNLSQKLKGMGIFTVLDFIKLDASHVRKKMGVVGERMFWELQGMSTIDLEKREAKKSIAFSRSFGESLNSFSDLAEALSTFVSKACVKMRKQNSFTSAIQVYLEVAFSQRESIGQKSYGTQLSFPQPTNDTFQIITYAIECLKKIYNNHINYKKCGIVLLDLINEKNIVPDFLLGEIDPKRKKIMETVDTLNQRFGKRTLFFAAEGVTQKWKGQSKKCSSQGVSDWNHLPMAYARA